MLDREARRKQFLDRLPPEVVNLSRRYLDLPDVEPDGSSACHFAASSAGWATAGAYDTSLNYLENSTELGVDVFVAKLSADGSSLLYATYVGGSGWDVGFAIALDSSGNAYVTGATISSGWATAGAYDTSYNDGFNGTGFVAKLSADGKSLLYATYLGGSNAFGLGIAVDGSGNAYVTGNTTSAGWATAGAYDASYNGGLKGDGFVAKLSASGSSLLYATYLGGSGMDVGRGIAVDGSGCAYVTGSTDSDGWATAGAYDTSFSGGYDDVFVAKLSASGSSLLYATYLGGSDSDTGYGIAVDGSGNAYVTGMTYSAGWATAGAYDTSYNGGGDSSMEDVFVAKLDGDGSSLLYATYLGGSGVDRGYGIAVDGSGSAYVTGFTSSDGWATAEAYDTSCLHGDVFVAKLSFAESAPGAITGTSGDDQIYININAGTLTWWIVAAAGPAVNPAVDPPTGSQPLSEITILTVQGGDGNDTIILDLSGGALSAADGGGVLVDGGDGNDRLLLKGVSGAADLGALPLVVGPERITSMTSIESIGFADGAVSIGSVSAGMGLIASGTAHVILAASMSVGTLEIAAARVELAGGADKVLVLRALDIAEGGVLDLNDGGLIVRTDGAGERDAMAERIGGLIARARNTKDAEGVLWGGWGISSGAAAAGAKGDLVGKTGLRGLGVAANFKVDAAGAVAGVLRETFMGVDGLDVNAVLVGYGLNGDADLSGRIDFDDYFQINSGFLSNGAKKGFGNGDFNFDRRIDFDDYYVINSAFLGQGRNVKYSSATGHYYELVEDGAVTADAKAKAESMRYSGMNGHFATVTSQPENDFIAASLLSSANGLVYWLGGYQMAGSSDPAAGWKWVTDEEWDFSAWGLSEPNDHGGQEEEDRLQIYAIRSILGTWNDSTGDDLIGYVIEYEPS